MNINTQIKTSAFILFSVYTETLRFLMHKGSSGTFSALSILASCASKPSIYMLISHLVDRWKLIVTLLDRVRRLSKQIFSLNFGLIRLENLVVFCSEEELPMIYLNKSKNSEVQMHSAVKIKNNLSPMTKCALLLTI